MRKTVKRAKGIKAKNFLFRQEWHFFFFNSSRKNRWAPGQNTLQICETMYFQNKLCPPHITRYFVRVSEISTPDRNIDVCIMTIYAYAASRKTYLPCACISWIICWIFAEHDGTSGIFSCADGIFPPGTKSECRP